MNIQILNWVKSILNKYLFILIAGLLAPFSIGVVGSAQSAKSGKKILTEKARHLIESGLAAGFTVDSINFQLDEIARSPDGSTDFERKIVKTYLDNLQGLKLTQEEFEAAVRAGNRSSEGVQALLGEKDEIFNLVNEKRYDFASEGLLAWLRQSVSGSLEHKKLKKIIEVGDIEKTASVVEFFAAKPYQVDVSKHRLMVVENNTSDSFGAFVSCGSQDNNLFADLNLNLAIKVDGVLHDFNFPLPDAKTFLPYAYEHFFGGACVVVVNEKRYNTVIQHRRNTVLVQEIHHLFDILTNPDIVSRATLKKQKTIRENQWPAIRAGLEQFYDKETVTEAYKVWFEKTFRLLLEEKRENALDDLFGAQAENSRAKNGVDPLVSLHRQEFKIFLRKNFLENAESLYYYLGSEVEKKGHTAQLRYLKELGLDFAESCFVCSSLDTLETDGRGFNAPGLSTYGLHIVKYSFYKEWKKGLWN